MKALACTLLCGLLLLTSGCKPDAAVKRGAVVDEPTPKTQPTPVVDKPMVDKPQPLKKVN